MWEVLWPLLRTLLAVVLVLCLAYVFTKYVVGKGKLGGLGAAGGGEDLRVLALLALSKDQKLAVVKAGERFFLLGIGPGGVSNLAEFTPEQASVWTDRPDPPEDGQPASFRDLLRAAQRQRKQR